MPDRLESEIATREITRWRGKPALIAVVAFFAALILLLVLCGMITGAWTGGQFPARAPNPGPAANPAWNNAPPQLQTHAGADLATVRAQEYQRLHTVQWIDTTHAYAVIPIDDAMSLFVSAAASGEIDQILPVPKPATPIDLQVQKSSELAPPAQPPAKP